MIKWLLTLWFDMLHIHSNMHHIYMETNFIFALNHTMTAILFFFFFQAEDGIRDVAVTGVQTCALPIYNYSVPNLSAQGLTCRARATMVLTQHSASFAGTYTGDLVCTASGYYDSTGSAGAVANGGISGGSGYFDFDNTKWHDIGVVARGSLQGLVNVHISANGTPMVLAGNFTATKQ